ncbi:MAG: cation:proton antiporter [Candidatus Thorarchaeota archaeon]
METPLLFLAVLILIAGAALAKIAGNYKFPYPIPLIVAGLLLGLWIPAEGLTDLIGLDFIAQLTLATVLFYAGLTMNIRELAASAKLILFLSTLGVLATALVAGVTILVVFPAVGLFVAFLIGSILTPTDPAALFSVLESSGVRVKKKLSSILEGEAVFNDATAVILVLTVFVAGVVPELEQTAGGMLTEFVLSIGLGVVVGLGVAFAIGKIILMTKDDTNVTIMTALTPILAFGIGEAITGFGQATVGLGIHPGILAAVFAGIFMANPRKLGLDPLPRVSMRTTMKNVSFAFEIVIFLLMGLTVDTEFILTTPNILPLGLGIAALVIFVARPAIVFAITMPDRSISMKERLFLSWAGVKGVASAALAAIAVAVITNPAYTVPDSATLGQTISSLVFIVLMVSLLLQGLTTPFLAERLNLIEEEDIFEEISTKRDATRHALLSLVDEYTERRVEASLYKRLKAELEEEIFTLEDNLRKMAAEKRARMLEVTAREQILQQKLSYYEQEYEKGRLRESVYADQKAALEDDLNSLYIVKKQIEEGK